MSERTLVLYPALKTDTNNGRSVQARLEEAKSLTRAINLDVALSEVVPLTAIRPATFMGKGNVERFAQVITEMEITLAVMDCSLTPIQQRNLEKAWACKVIDRTALILEIFGERARTKEGTLQVELAHLSYQKSRLVRSWTHLERQRGGKGFLGGPGETQIELDRRIITDTIVGLKKELEEVKRTRHLHRKARQRVPYPIVALVGYTNSGKSTLFNRLTQSDVFAKDLLFATLDPTMRVLKLPSGRRVILSDTVGFISQLPTELVMAFRATLEEVLEASLVIHVRDCSHTDTEPQRLDVEGVLGELGLGNKIEQGLLEAFNKIDLLDESEKNAVLNASTRKESSFPVSALTGQGMPELLAEIEKRLSVGRILMTANVPVSDGSAVAYLYEIGEVLGRVDNDEFCQLSVRLEEQDKIRFEKKYPQVIYGQLCKPLI